MPDHEVEPFPPLTLAEAVWVDSGRRDRELILGDALRRLPGDLQLDEIADPETQRRAGYLIDLAQQIRGQTAAEEERLAAVRSRLPMKPLQSFWTEERALPPGTDPIAERWGFARGVDVLRLRAAMTRPVGLLPPGS